jgi:hypothetical protein
MNFVYAFRKLELKAVEFWRDMVPTQFLEEVSGAAVLLCGLY